jgi:hypothetical protein
MSLLPQNPDTTANQSGRYEPATTSVTGGTKVADTVAILPDIRTTVTRRMQGTIELRYTPREPNPTTTTTASP